MLLFSLKLEEWSEVYERPPPGHASVQKTLYISLVTPRNLPIRRHW